MIEMFLILLFGEGKVVLIGLMFYDGGVYFGFNGDCDVMIDIDVFVLLFEELIVELVEVSLLLSELKMVVSGSVPMGCWLVVWCWLI